MKNKPTITQEEFDERVDQVVSSDFISHFSHLEQSPLAIKSQKQTMILFAEATLKEQYDIK